MPHPFKVGKQYRNRKGTYTVLCIEGENMDVRTNDGSTTRYNIEQQARIWEHIQEEAADGEEPDFDGDSSYGRGEHKTAEIRDFVASVLRTVPQPWRPDVTDQVFLAIERRPEWLVEYNALKGEFSQSVLNMWIGRYVKDITGLEGHRSATAKSILISSYTVLLPVAK